VGRTLCRCFGEPTLQRREGGRRQARVGVKEKEPPSVEEVSAGVHLARATGKAFDDTVSGAVGDEPRAVAGSSVRHDDVDRLAKFPEVRKEKGKRLFFV
jgi:hypothetical protein